MACFSRRKTGEAGAQREGGERCQVELGGSREEFNQG